jgi:putative phosphoesterase
MDVFAGVDRILHAGDVGDESVLAILETLAPTVAVRGNMDHAGPVRSLPPSAGLVLEGVRVSVQHFPRDGRASRVRPVADVFVSGHTHRPEIAELDGVLFVNPGSASHPRGGWCPTVAVLEIEDGQARAWIVEL